MDRADGSLIKVAPCRYGRMLYLTNDSFIGHALGKYGEYSESEVALWRQFIKPDWIVADCGANIGAHTVALAQMAQAVVAFEPLPYLYFLLCGNLALNGITNVSPHPWAVGADRGTLPVPYIDYTQPGAYGGWNPNTLPAVTRTVPVVALDDCLPHVDFVKLDVEGMELDALFGMERLLTDARPVVYVEAQQHAEQIIAELQSHDYDCWWDHAPHFNPQNVNGVTADDLPTTPAPALLGIPAEQEATVGRQKVEVPCTSA